MEKMVVLTCFASLKSSPSTVGRPPGFAGGESGIHQGRVKNRLCCFIIFFKHMHIIQCISVIQSHARCDL